MWERRARRRETGGQKVAHRRGAPDARGMPQEPAKDADRRKSPRRRLRDRIASLDSADNPSLRQRHELKNHLLLVEDDLRETALALGALEGYLARSMELIEDEALSPSALLAHADDIALPPRLETLSENLDNLRRRMRCIAAAMDPEALGPAV